MVPIPAEYLPDFWNQISTECTIEVTCLLPNGIIILLNVNYNATLADIKEVCHYLKLELNANKSAFRICGRKRPSFLFMENCTICRCTYLRTSILWLKRKNLSMNLGGYVTFGPQVRF